MNKRILLSLLSCIACCIMCIGLKAQDKNVVLFEDFEKGIPSSWTQEKLIGDYEWIVESGDLDNPKGAVSGDLQEGGCEP